MTYSQDINMGKSKMLPVLKLEKEEAPLKNLKRINLLCSIRKIYFIITLNRIKDKVGDYLSASQTA